MPVVFPPVIVTAEDKALAQHLRRIEVYLRGCQLVRHPRQPTALRSELAEFLGTRLRDCVVRWSQVVKRGLSIDEAERLDVERSMYDAQMRWLRHVEYPGDVETYRVLRQHARGGFISEFPASRFLAAQMKLWEIYRSEIEAAYASDPTHRDELLDLLEQESLVRILHITDFFVEAQMDTVRDQESSYEQTIEHAPAPIFRASWDDGAVLDANARAEAVTDYRRRDLVGCRLWDLFPEDERVRVRQHWRDACELGHAVTEDLHLLCREGTVVPVFVSSSVIHYGKERYVQHICVDRSERRRLEAQLIQSEKMAAVGQLAAGVAHEIRNPLAAIRNALFDLKDVLAGGGSEATEDLRVAEEELERAKGIIDNLLEFSSPAPADRDEIDLNDLIRKTVRLMHRSVESARVAVHSRLGELPLCRTNENAMRQVVLNLMTNAIQAMPDGGKLTITTRGVERNGGSPRIVLEVADTGTGIPAELLGDVFNPFFTTKAPGQGTGLGLSVVDSIVRQNDGEIHVESVVGEGTTFHLELPGVAEKEP